MRSDASFAGTEKGAVYYTEAACDEITLLIPLWEGAPYNTLTGVLSGMIKGVVGRVTLFENRLILNITCRSRFFSQEAAPDPP
jgi:hypothetical protein